MSLFGSIRSGFDSIGSGFKSGLRSFGAKASSALNTMGDLASGAADITQKITPMVSMFNPAMGLGLSGATAGLRIGSEIAKDIPKSALLK